MTRRTPRRLIAGAVALSCGIGAASAIAAPKPKPAAKAAPSKIVYVCGKNLCAVDPISRTTTRVTTDNGGYRWPSVSANGQRVAAVGGGGIRAGRYGTNLPEKWSGMIEGINGLAMSPNGRQIAATHWYTRLEQKYVYSYTCGSSYSCVQLQLQHYNGTQVYTKPNTPTSQRGDSGPGYLGGALLSTGQDYGEWDSTVSDYVGGTVSVCSIASPTGADPTCTTRVTLPNPPTPGARRVHLSDPTGSRDGNLIAVTIGDVWEEAGKIVDQPWGENPRIGVFDARTGAPIAVHANGKRAAFSPDGRHIVFEGTDGSIRVAPARGGASRRVATGQQPTWATGAIVAAPVAWPPARVRKAATSVRLRCAPTQLRPCVGRIALRSGTRTLATARFSLKRGQAQTIPMRLTPVGRRMSAAARRVKVDVVTTNSTGRVETGRRAAILTR